MKAEKTIDWRQFPLPPSPHQPALRVEASCNPSIDWGAPLHLEPSNNGTGQHPALRLANRLRTVSIKRGTANTEADNFRDQCEKLAARLERACVDPKRKLQCVVAADRIDFDLDVLLSAKTPQTKASRAQAFFDSAKRDMNNLHLPRPSSRTGLPI